MRQLNSKGFTLLETLIVVAIFAVGAAIAIPSIMDMGKSSEIKSDARQLKDQLAKARMEAIRRNQSVVILFDPNGTDYTVFEDKNGNNAYDGGGIDPDSMIASINTKSTFDATDLFAVAPRYISWNTKGQPSSFNVGNKTLEVSANGDTYEIIISMVGSVQIQKQ